MSRRSDDAGPRPAHRQENLRKRNGEASILRTSAPSGVPKPFSPRPNAIAARHGPPTKRGVPRRQAKAAKFAPAAVTANDEETFNAPCGTDPDDSVQPSHRDPTRIPSAVRRAPESNTINARWRSTNKRLSRFHGPTTSAAMTPAWRRMDRQSGPGIADLGAETLQPLPHGVITAGNRCRVNLQIHSRR